MIIPTQASKEAAERILRIAQDDPETARRDAAEIVQAASDLNSRAVVKAAKAGCCEVCWTTSWEPCEKGDPGAQQYKDGSGYVSCSHCQLVNALLYKYVKREVLKFCFDEMEQAEADSTEALGLDVAIAKAREELGRTKEPEFQVLES